MARPKTIRADPLHEGPAELAAIFAEVAETMGQVDNHPARILAKAALNPKANLALRIKAAMAFLEYLHPKLKGMEVRSTHTETISVRIKSFTEGQPDMIRTWAGKQLIEERPATPEDDEAEALTAPNDTSRMVVNY